MLFRHWFQRGQRPAQSFRPAVQQLEDRDVPSSVPLGPAPLTTSGLIRSQVQVSTTVTHFGIVATAHAISGHAVPVVVEALNAANQVVTGYTGTVTFTSSDVAAMVGATQSGTAVPVKGFTYTFTVGKSTAADNGRHTFYVTFNTLRQQTLTVTDSTNNLTGSCAFVVLPGPPFRKGRR
jgi:hypothetical protein